MVLRVLVPFATLALHACASDPTAAGVRRSDVLASPEVLYEDDFDTCDSGWMPSGTGSTWACGTPLSEPDGDHDGSGLAWATALDGAYGRHEESALTSPEIDLSPHTGGGG